MAAVAALAAALVPGAPALGQGTSGMVPDPISSPELSRYLDRLGANLQQRQAAAVFHEQYKADFKTLRDGEIQKLLDEMGKLQGMGGSIPDRKDVVDLLDNRKKLMSRIEGLDSVLFNNLQPLLTEEQAGLMPRVHMARARQRLTNRQMMMPMMSGSADLSEIVPEIELSSADRGLADSVLQGYEVRLTKLTEDLHDASVTMMLDIMDAFEAAGFTSQEDFMDPETGPKAMETMQAIFQQVMKKSVEISADIGKLNRQTYRSLASILPRPEARKLGRKFYGKAYPEVFWGAGMGGDAQAAFEKALRFKDLTDEQRQVITAAGEQFAANAERIVEEMADLIDEQRERGNPFDFGGEAFQDHQKKLNEHREELGKLSASALASLTEVLGEQLAAKIKEPEAADNVVVGGAVMVQGVGGGSAAIMLETPAEEEREEGGPDQFVPGPITAANVRSYARRLAIAEDDQALLDEFHAAYRAKYDELRSGSDFKSLSELQQQLWGQGEDESGAAVDIEDVVQRLASARSRGLAAVRALDESFFREIEDLVLTTDEQKALMPRIRLARERAIYNRTPWMGDFGMMGGSHSGIDLVRLLDQQRLAPADLGAADAVLVAYERSVTDAMRRRFELQLQLQASQDKAMAEMQAAQKRGEGMAAAFDYSTMWQENARKSAEASKAVADLNRATLERLVAALPGEAGANLRRDYNRRAYPDIYNDPRSAEARIDQALKLPSLDAEQRRQVEEIAKTFRTSYADLSEQMVAIKHDADEANVATFEAADWQEFQKRQNRVGSIRFERSEVSAAALLRLKEVLTADQVAAIGGLDDLMKAEGRDMFFFE
jgi:hypothetical protein